MLVLKDIVKTYGQEDAKLEALGGVSLEFGKTGLVAVLGPSGCGKTTLLNIVGGLDQYTSGDMAVNGVSTKDYKNSDWDAYRNNNVGFVFQTYFLIPHLNVLENIMLAMDLSGAKADEQKSRAMRALERVGVADQAKKKPKQLSGGQAQRVAIARAIVNNPDIILADEPTGALDTENSVQVLALLKEISKTSLVILVTHNAELAYEYADRIIKLKDGKVLLDEFNLATIKAENIEDAKATPLAEDGAQDQPVNLQKTKNKKVKTTMKMTSAFKMSLKNLYYKKGRTLLTAVAGCIGVVSIALILAFNAGFSAYTNKFERDSLSKYPITIAKSDSKMLKLWEEVSKDGKVDTSVIDMNQILGMLKDEDNERIAYTDEQKVYMEKQISSIMGNMGNLFKGNDTTKLKQYIDENMDKSLATVKYDYGLNPNIFRGNYSSKGELLSYTQVNPYAERILNSLNDFVKLMGGNFSDFISNEDMNNIVSALNSLNVWDALVDDTDVLNSQYEILSGDLPDPSKESTGVYEIVLVVDEYNQLTDNMLYALGYIELASMFTEVIGKFLNIQMESNIPTEYAFSDFIGKEFKLLQSKDYYNYNPDTMLYEEITDKNVIKNTVNEKGLTLRISGILRVKENADSGSINGVIGYPQSLAQLMITNANDSDIVKAQTASYQAYLLKTQNPEVLALEEALEEGTVKESELTPSQKMLRLQAKTATITNVITGEEIAPTDYFEILKNLSAEDVDSPDVIYLYPKSVDAKNKVIAFIEEYNAQMRSDYAAEISDEDYSVEYVNELNDIMKSLNTMINTITYILVAVTCLAVVVSLFMVGIIMYISVQDRTKEIGILRSMGARNIDITTIFNTETVLLGLISGLVGVGLSYILQYPINAILNSVLGISRLIQPIWWYSLILIGASVMLTLVSGLIPALVAAKKDPVTALKTE